MLYIVTGSTLLYTGILATSLAVTGVGLQGMLQFVLSRYGNNSFDDVSGFWDNVFPIMVLVVLALAYAAETGGLSFG